MYVYNHSWTHVTTPDHKKQHLTMSNDIKPQVMLPWGK